MSDARWRQIVKGSMQVRPRRRHRGHRFPATLARMAYAVNVTPEALREAGRDDAAGMLASLIDAVDHETSAVPLPATGATGDQADEIDMIYASQSMTPEQKLKAIRQVLQLRAQAEQEQTQLEARKVAPQRRLKARVEADTASASSGHND